MLESLIREAADRFNLGGNAGPLVRQLIDAIFDPDSGGFAGLRDRFANAGLGNAFASWLGGGSHDAPALQPDQFAAGFGANAVNDIAGKVGIPASTVSAAGAFLLPKIVGALTPGGEIPSGRPGWLDGLFGGLGAAVSGIGNAARDLGGAATGAVGSVAHGVGGAARDLGGAATGAAGAAVGAAGAAVGAAGDALRGVGGGIERQGERIAGGGGIWKWLVPLLLLAGAFFWYRSCHRQEAAPAADATEAAAPATNASEMAQADAANADASNAAADAAAAADANASATAPGANASVAPAADASAAPNAAADAALSGIKSGASVDDVLKALNLMIIHFATGSANIDHDSDAILAKAAEAIKSLPAGTKLEVGGHTDNVGKAASNQTLSQKRADAVVARLGELGVAAGTLGGKGYGDSKPVADNGTAEGRAQNRRIEFTAAQ